MFGHLNEFNSQIFYQEPVYLTLFYTSSKNQHFILILC